MNDIRVTEFMTRILARAAEQERASLRPLATVGAGHRKPLESALPGWYELRPPPESTERPFLPRLMQYAGNYSSKGGHTRGSRKVA